MKTETEKVCPWCQSASYCKNGFVEGQQRYRCKSCKKNFTVFKKGKSLESIYLVDVLHLYLEGFSARQITNSLGIAHTTVLKWIKQYAPHLSVPRKRGEWYRLTAAELAAHVQTKAFQESANGWCVTSRGFCLPVG